MNNNDRRARAANPNRSSAHLRLVAVNGELVAPVMEPEARRGEHDDLTADRRRAAERKTAIRRARRFKYGRR